MTEITAAEALSGHDRACLLVGQFMWRWGALESAVNSAYRKLLNLKPIEGYIATANITLRDKLSAVRTVVHWFCGSETEWWKAADADLNAIGTLNGTRRNVVAHNAFMEHPSGGVEFVIIKAKGKFAIPDVIWEPEEFTDVFLEIGRLHDRLTLITEHVVATRLAKSGGLAGAIMNPYAIALSPTPGPGLIGGLYHQVLHPPAPLDAPSPTPKSRTRTTKAPQAKSRGKKSQK